MTLMLSMCMIVYIKVVTSQQLCTCTGCKTFSNEFTQIGPLPSQYTEGPMAFCLVQNNFVVVPHRQSSSPLS